MAPVVPQSATALMKVIDKKLLQGVKHLHLMVSSPGGSVFHGLSIYNFLKGSPLKVTTYNFGTVDSIGVVIFCAGSERISVPHARFLIHGVSMNMNGNFTFDEKALEEKLKLLKIDYFNIAKVIADTTGKKTKSIVEDMNSRTTLNPTEAKKYGLVHKIQSHLFPSAADLTVIHEDASIFELPATTAPQPVAQPTPVMQIPASMPFTAPKVQGFTEASTLSHGTFFV